MKIVWKKLNKVIDLDLRHSKQFSNFEQTWELFQSIDAGDTPIDVINAPPDILDPEVAKVLKMNELMMAEAAHPENRKFMDAFWTMTKLMDLFNELIRKHRVDALFFKTKNGRCFGPVRNMQDLYPVLRGKGTLVSYGYIKTERDKFLLDLANSHRSMTVKDIDKFNETVKIKENMICKTLWLESIKEAVNSIFRKIKGLYEKND